MAAPALENSSAITNTAMRFLGFVIVNLRLSPLKIEIHQQDHARTMQFDPHRFKS
jgi:hypothetical protein